MQQNSPYIVAFHFWEIVLYGFCFFLPLFLWGYGGFTWVKRFIFERFDLRRKGALPTLLVGNLSVGGTGKTPMVLFLIEAFSGERIAVLSRGYGRNTRGFKAVEVGSTALEVGDEPLEVFHSQITAPVRVCEQRLEGIQRIKQEQLADWILLDDGYQHLKLRADKNVILSDFQRPFWKERFSLPLGNLREFSSALKGADALIITKCPENLVEQEAAAFVRKLPIEMKKVFFAHYKQTEPRIFRGSIDNKAAYKAILITGIAQQRGMSDKMGSWQIVQHLSYRDHKNFSLGDVHYWLKTCKERAVNSLIFTRKDVQRILGNGLIEVLLDEGMCIYEIHTEVEILWNRKKELLRRIDPLRMDL